MANEDDDFELVKLGLITLDKNRYDVFDLYEKEDCDSNDFVFGRYFMKKWHIIIGKADKEDQLSRNLSAIAIFSKKRGLNKFRGISKNIFNKDFYFN